MPSCQMAGFPTPHTTPPEPIAGMLACLPQHVLVCGWRLGSYLGRRLYRGFCIRNYFVARGCWHPLGNCLHNRRPGLRRSPERKDAVAAGGKVVLRRRTVWHRPRIIKWIGAHRATRASTAQQASGQHERPSWNCCATYSMRHPLALRSCRPFDAGPNPASTETVFTNQSSGCSPPPRPTHCFGSLQPFP